MYKYKRDAGLGELVATMAGMYLLTTFLRFGLGHDLVRHERRLQPPEPTAVSLELQTKRKRKRSVWRGTSMKTLWPGV